MAAFQSQQLTFFRDKAPAPKRKPKTPKPAPETAALIPIAPPDLRQESALWLLGQRSIAEQRGLRYVPESVKHPGKMQPDVAGAIIDPMGGIGTTAVEAAERGRHVVMVELEKRWAPIAQQNADLTARSGSHTSMSPGRPNR